MRKSQSTVIMRNALRERYPLVLKRIEQLPDNKNNIDKLCEMGILDALESVSGYNVKWREKAVITAPDDYVTKIGGKGNQIYKVFRFIAHRYNEELKNGN